MNAILKPKVFVAMSGGVDSSVAAALLKKSGKYDIVGVFCRGWQPEGMVCGWKEERRDALRAAAEIGVPFLTFNFSKEYEKKVVEYMKHEYAAGRTPNPDVMCNKYIKFGLFLEKALEMGADMIATGHYVKISNLKSLPADATHQALQAGQISKIPLSKFKLLQAKDKNKDQSYFLWTLTQEQLKHCLFPIGKYTKPEVRQMARNFGLRVAEKKDSQGLCFVGDINFASFLKKLLPKKEGEIRTAGGKVIGRHDGAHFYTIGQRHGFSIPGGPHYIVAKDIKKNILFVSDKPGEGEFYQKEAEIEDANWISGNPPFGGKIYQARIRHRQPLQNCRITNGAGFKSFKVAFNKPQRAVTSGQSLVLYRGPAFAKASAGKEMLGGGIIK